MVFFRKEAIIASVIAVLMVFLWFFLTGQTFGQRCAKAYPDDPAQQEWCVIRLNKGGTVYPKPEGAE